MTEPDSIPRELEHAPCGSKKRRRGRQSRKYGEIRNLQRFCKNAPPSRLWATYSLPGKASPFWLTGTFIRVRGVACLVSRPFCKYAYIMMELATSEDFACMTVRVP